MKTAVEYLADKLPFELKFLLMTEIEEAKELEKQQIIEALHYFEIEYAEKYYNETFKSE